MINLAEPHCKKMGGGIYRLERENEK